MPKILNMLSSPSSDSCSEQSKYTVESDEEAPEISQLFFEVSDARTPVRWGNATNVQMTYFEKQWWEWRSSDHGETWQLRNFYPQNNTVESLRDWLRCDYGRVGAPRVLWCDGQVTEWGSVE